MTKKIIYIVLTVISLFSCRSNSKNQTNTIHNVAKTDLPIIRVLDTDFSKGRLTLEHDINLQDLEKFHGHLCDGLVQGFLGIQDGLKVLYPKGVIDRTNTRIVSKSSPCLTDAAIYLTGGRYQYHSFYVDNYITDGFYIMQRIDNHKAVKIEMKPGVKPIEIDEMGAKAIRGILTPCELEKLKNLEENFAKHLLSTDSKNNFTITELVDFEWKPLLKNDYPKTDILNKNKLKCQ